MRYESSDQQFAATNLTNSEQLAVFTLRQVIRGRLCRASTKGKQVGISQDLEQVAIPFRGLWGQDGRLSRCPIQLGFPGGTSLTKDEKRLLYAIAAAQAEETGMLDNHLFKLALDQTICRRLTEAIMILAAILALQGCWLPRPTEERPAPGSTPKVAYVHGRDLDDIQVAWPNEMQSPIEQIVLS